MSPLLATLFAVNTTYLINTAILAIVSAILLVVIIKAVTGQNTTVLKTFVLCFVAAVVASFLYGLISPHVESVVLSAIIGCVLYAVAAGFVVQQSCSTDLKKIVLIIVIYAAAMFVIQAVAVRVMNALSAS